MKLIATIDIRGMIGGAMSIELLQTASVAETFHVVAETPGLMGFQSSTSQLLTESSTDDHLYYKGSIEKWDTVKNLT